MKRLIALVLTLFSIACASNTPPAKANDREWKRLVADYQWLESLRGAQSKSAASRKNQIESLLETHRKTKRLRRFPEQAQGYLDGQAIRACSLYANERIRLGDSYMYVLARYDRAIAMYESALAVDPQNAAARQRLDLARLRRFVELDSFSRIHTGMSEDEVRRLVGMPREDWIKQVIQKGRVYSVWIYPKRDGGASAVYFDNGQVYHTNWNAAPGRSTG